MDVRKAQRGDLAALLDLYSYLTDNEKQLNINEYNAIWDEIQRFPDKYAYFVIEAGQRIVSTCNITIIPNLTRGARPFAVIENVVTHPDYRKKGFGRIIMEAAVGFAVEKHCYKVMLLSNVKRKEAHVFYEHIGFCSDKKAGFVKELE